MPAFVLALLAGPFAFAAAHLGKPDPNDLYLVFDFGSDRAAFSDIIESDLRAIGPQRGILAEMIQAPPDAFASLLATGYFVLPAGPFAALCGHAQVKTHPSTESI